jgi:hypothetical protein
MANDIKRQEETKMATGLWSRWTATPTRQIVTMSVAGLVAIAAGIGAGYLYSNRPVPKEVSYRVCLGTDAKLCPPQTVFVQNIGLEPVADWVNKQCARYKKRETIESEGPTKECDCALVEVKCTTSL